MNKTSSFSSFSCRGLMLFSALLAVFSFAKDDSFEMSLGTVKRTSDLFAYPNNCHVICYRNWTLEQTVEHYLSFSIARDNFQNGNVSVKIIEDEVFASFAGVSEDYTEALSSLLNAGDLAFEGATKLNKDGKWAFNWYLFLPLGMSLVNRKSVELLHFPPDYSLIQAQDYLESATTDRWAQLLVDNGIPTNETPGFQAIIDIAPIAAPSDAGSTLEGVYDYFTAYQTTMVALLSQDAKGEVLPMVAFGAPVQNWIKVSFTLLFFTLCVLTLPYFRPLTRLISVC